MAIRAEYIGGGISQRELAKKYGVSAGVLMNKANAEGWKKQRDDAESKALAKSVQKAANAVADNATIAAEIQREMLMRLKHTVEKFPLDATEVRQQKDGKTIVFKLRDLAATYKDLTEGMPKGEGADMEDLNPLVELLK